MSYNEEVISQVLEAVDAAGQGVWVYDGKRKRWTFSASWKLMRGLKPDEAYESADDSWLDRIHPSDREMVRREVDDQYNGVVDAVAYEYRELHMDGHWIWIHARGRCISRDAQGLPLRIVGTDTDITELKNRDLVASAMKQRLELALASSQIGLWETDLNTGLSKWDSRTSELFGFAPEAITASPQAWENCLHPQDRDSTIAHCLAELQQTGGYRHDYRIVRPDGAVRHVRCIAEMGHNAEGLERLMGVNWDVTPEYQRLSELRDAIKVADERSETLEYARQAMEHMSFHDALTGLPNRRMIDKVLDDLQGSGHSVTVLHLDLDQFKVINDTAGHAAGDAYLVRTARVFKDWARDAKLVARTGGDEFIVIFSPSPEAEDLVERVDALLRHAAEPYHWHGYSCQSSVSVGIASNSGSGDLRMLLTDSDMALHEAKRAGRNRAVFFSQALQAEVIRSRANADDIRRGLLNREFVPFYQPQVDAHTHLVVGLEALVRWRHPERGMLPPAAFLDDAYSIDVVGQIDEMVLEQACRDIASWDAMGLVVPKISTNVSAQRLADDEFVNSIVRLHVAPSRLSFEILETIFLDRDSGSIMSHINELKDKGYHIELDDFGSGHASIVSLLKIKPRVMKIDRELVAPLHVSKSQRLLIKSIVDIGKSQGIAVCAEGVETQSHAEVLRDLGCDYLQGYHFAKPMAADVLPDFLRDKLQPLASAELRDFMRENGLDRQVANPEVVCGLRRIS